MTIRLAEKPATARHAISARVDAQCLSESGRNAVEITRAGDYWDPRYGDFSITPAMLAEMVRNFNGFAYGQDIFIDVSHQPENGSAGRIVRLWVSDNRLLAEVDWTDYGRQAITERGFVYLSAEYVEQYTDNETRRAFGCVLLGAGLTIRPVIKRQSPIQLAEPLTLHRALLTRLLSEVTDRMNKYLENLLKKLAELKLDKKLIDELGKAYSEAAKTLGEDDQALATLADQILGVGKTLAEQPQGQPTTITLSLQPPTPATPPPVTLTEADILRIMATERQREAETAAATARTLAERKAQFTALTDKSESLKGLSEVRRSKLLGIGSLITAQTSAAQVEEMAAQIIALADQMIVETRLAGLGWPIQGSTRISTGDDEHGPIKLQAKINDRLRRTGRRMGLLAEDKLPAAAQKILAEFDRVHGHALREESIRLADGGATTVSNMNVPVGFQRTVIREALSDLNVLNLVQVITDPSAQATTQIPYELRKPGTVVNDGVVYEGQGIPRASIEQKMDTAYVNKMPLSLRISNEAAFFSNSSLIDWDAYARNVDSNARLIRELVARRIANELQRSADAYGATARSAENIASQVDGSHSLIKTTYWPIVRPQQIRDLQGTAIGSASNPITVVLNGATLSQYDGSGSQSAGTYWKVESYNLGLIRLVNQLGVAVTPTASSTTTISYSSANNLIKFDLKLASGELLEDHLNGALRALGAQKAIMSTDRYILPDMQLMSPVLNDVLTNARQFTAEAQRTATALNNDGDLSMIKAIPAFGTNAPGIDLGDERILLGQRGTLSYVLVKPFMTGTPFEAVDSNGLPTGERIAYGEEYNAIHIPSPLQNRLTSVIVYDSDARTAAA